MIVNIRNINGVVEVVKAIKTFDAEGKEVGQKKTMFQIEAGNKEKLVEVVGQQLADAIEAEYWTTEVIAQAQENIASPA